MYILVYCIKLIIIAFGLGSGGLLMAIGIGPTQMPDKMRTLIEEAKIPQPQIVFIIIGAMFVAVSILSLLKLIQNSSTGKMIFCGVMVALVIGLLIIGWIIFTHREQFYADAIENYDKAWKDQCVPGGVSIVLNSINQFLQCCGPYSPDDYLGEIPSSCCEAPIDGICPVAGIFMNGCRKAVTDYIASQLGYFGYASIAIAILLILLLVEALGCKKQYCAANLNGIITRLSTCVDTVCRQFKK